jgi:signal transduction histidine kinase/CheY-like chemotaxis protein
VADTTDEKKSTQPQADPYAAPVRIELYRLFIRQCGRVPLGVILLIPMLFYMLREQIPLAQRIVWAVPVAAGLIARWHLARRFQSLEESPERLANRARLLTGLWALTGLAASLGPFIWFPSMLLVDRALFSIGYMAWYAGAVVVSLVSPVSAFLFGACLLAPLAFGWTFYGGEIGVAIGLVFLVLLFFVRLSVDDAYDALRGAIRSRLREESLGRSLEQRGHEVESAMRARTQFLAAASHDLRQPVTSMNLLLSAMVGAKDEQSLRAVAAKFEAPLQALDEILSSLLEVSRLEAGTVRVERRPCNLRDLIIGVQIEYTPRATAKHIGIRTGVPNLSVVTDPELLRRILRNLVDNAVKFTDEGSVQITASASGSVLTLRVSDTGRGIPDDARARIFDDYFQADNPQRDRRQGLGLGLSIVRGLVELLHGRIEVQSKPGKGTLFTVRLPVLAVRAAREPDVRFDASAPLDIPFDTVLVVDDDPLVREAFATLMEPAGIDVEFAANAEEALALLDRAGSEPQLAIIDFGLPGQMDGISLIGELRRRLPALLTLLVTGDTRPAVIRRAAEAKVSVLHKPFTASQFAAMLERIAPNVTPSQAGGER